MQRHSPAVITAILVVALATAAVSADNPFVGTWKLNLAKSKYSPGPPPKAETWILEAQENGQKDTFDGVGADGKTYHVQAAPKYDGKDYPVAGDPGLDAVALKKIDANTIDFVTKKGGKEIARGRIIISKDGRTMTGSEKGKDSKGQDFTNMTVYDRQ